MPFFSISGSDLVEMFVGVGASCVRVIAAAKAGGQTRHGRLCRYAPGTFPRLFDPAPDDLQSDVADDRRRSAAAGAGSL